MPTALAAPPPQSPANRSGSFPEDQFALIENVPVFAEHTTTHQGRELTFGPQELQAVVDRCNQRIQNTGDYAVLCLGHTPSTEARERGVQSPPAVGFAGPFRLGSDQDSDGNTRYVVLADFHVFHEDLPAVKKHPRRSAELWVEDTYEEMFLDPIALLGSEPPRLDMGNVYQRFDCDGREVLKYSYTMPGAANVALPSHVEPKRNDATEEPTMDPQEIVNQVIDGITSLPQWQWLTAQMDKDQQSGDTAGAEGQAAPDATPAEAPAPETTPEPAAPPAVQDPAERDKLAKFEALDEACGDMSDEDMEEYSAHRRRRRKGYEAAETIEEESVETADANYAKQGVPAKFARRLEQAEQKLLEERTLRIDGERRQHLQHLYDSGVMLDVNEEMDRLCYSKMESNDAFKQECKRIAKNYHREPTAIQLPEMLFDDSNSPEPAKYGLREAEELSKKARDLAIQKQRAGENVTFEQCFNELSGGRQPA